MDKDRFWQERKTRIGEAEYLVLRVLWEKKNPKDARWELEAWFRAPIGMGTFFLDGRWYIRPHETTAKRAIHQAFPDARGEWTGERLIEREGSPQALGPPKS